MPQTVDQQACQRCGAQNRPQAEFCWQCYTPFRRGGSTLRPDREYDPSALARAVSGRGAHSPPLARPGSGRPSALIGNVVRLLVLAGLALGGWFAWQHFRGFPFPEDIRGVPRFDSEVAEEALQAFQDVGKVFDLEMELALYGTTEEQPVYGMFVMEIPNEPGVLDQLKASRGDIIPIPEEAIQELKSLTFECSQEPEGGACAWRDDDLVLFVLGFGQSADEVRPTARFLREQLG